MFKNYTVSLIVDTFYPDERGFCKEGNGLYGKSGRFFIQGVQFGETFDISQLIPWEPG